LVFPNAPLLALDSVVSKNVLYYLIWIHYSPP
jgi:hypothetical protein